MTTTATKTVAPAAAARALDMLVSDRAARASYARSTLAQALQTLSGEIDTLATAVASGRAVDGEEGIERLVKAGLVDAEVVSLLVRVERDLAALRSVSIGSTPADPVAALPAAPVAAKETVSAPVAKLVSATKKTNGKATSALPEVRLSKVGTWNYYSARKELESAARSHGFEDLADAIKGAKSKQEVLALARTKLLVLEHEA